MHSLQHAIGCAAAAGAVSAAAMAASPRQGIFTSVDEVVFIAETDVHLAIQRLGFHDVSSVWRANTIGEVTGGFVTASADFTFVLDGTAFTGPGSWTSVEVPGSSLQITIDFALSSASQRLEYHYTSVGDLARGVRDETVDASLVDPSDAVIADMLLDKHTEVLLTPTSRTTSITALLMHDGRAIDSTVAIEEEILSPRISRYRLVCEDHPIVPPDSTVAADIEYELTVGPDDSVVATIYRHDVTVDGRLTYMSVVMPGVHRLTRVEADRFQERFLMVLQRVDGPFETIRLDAKGTIELTRDPDGLDTAWSWPEFGRTIIGCTAAALMDGAATAMLSDGAGPIVAGAQASLGSASGAAGGAAAHTVGKLLDAVFGDSVTGGWEKEGAGSAAGTRDKAGALTGTYAEGSLTCDQDVQGTLLVTRPCPADVNGDFVVDVRDLLEVLSAWGPYGPCPPYRAADIDRDCVVDVEDLLELLASWGRCS